MHAVARPGHDPSSPFRGLKWRGRESASSPARAAARAARATPRRGLPKMSLPCFRDVARDMEMSDRPRSGTIDQVENS